VSLAALQARAFLEKTGRTEADLAEVASRSRRDARANPNAQVTGDRAVEELLAEPYLVSPLRKHDVPPISDGAAAIVLAAGDIVKRASGRPAWIRGIDHRIEQHSLGARDLTSSPSTATAGRFAGVFDGAVDIAELHAPFTHQELILRKALRLGDGVAVNPSGGALAANPMMVAGLVRIGEAATRIGQDGATRAVAHATSGPCLQQNLVCVLEAA
jgi:acetyl-CoA acetyltransferase